MIRKLIKIAQQHDIAPGEALHVHVVEVGPCEDRRGYDAADAHHVAILQGVCPLSDFVDRWATDASEQDTREYQRQALGEFERQRQAAVGEVEVQRW